MKNNIFTQENLHQLMKYGLISIIGYSSILSLMFLFVKILALEKVISFFCVYTLAYFSEYFLNLKYLFDITHSWIIAAKYLLNIVFFLACGTIVFKLFITLNVHYLAATLLTAIVLLPLRFLAQKFLVFR